MLPDKHPESNTFCHIEYSNVEAFTLALKTKHFEHNGFKSVIKKAKVKELAKDHIEKVRTRDLEQSSNKQSPTIKLTSLPEDTSELELWEIGQK